MPKISNLLYKPHDMISSFLDDSNHSTLQKAVDAGDLKKVEEFLNKGLDPNQPMENGHLPLHAAVRRGNTLQVKLLLERGADVAKLDSDGLSAFDYASINPNKEIISALLSFTENGSGFFGSFFNRSSSQFEFAEAKNILTTQTKINSFRTFLLRNLPKDELSQIILKQDLPKLEEFLKKRVVVNENHLLLAIFLKNEALTEKLLNRFKGDLNGLHKDLSCSLVHVAAWSNHAAILKSIVMRGGDLQKKNKDNIAPADLLFAKGASRDPLHLSKAKFLLTLFGLSVIFYENMVEPVLSPQNVAFLKGALLLLNLSTEVALNYQLYLQVNPQTLFQKTFFWASNLATIPMHMGISQVPLLKLSWDLWRCYQVTTNAFHELRRSFRHYSFDKTKALTHASMQILSVGSTYYHCRKTAGMLRDIGKSLFKTNPPVTGQSVEAEDPQPAPTRKTEDQLPVTKPKTEDKQPASTPKAEDQLPVTKPKTEDKQPAPTPKTENPQPVIPTKTEEKQPATPVFPKKPILEGSFCCKKTDSKGQCLSDPRASLTEKTDPKIRAAIESLESKADVLRDRVKVALKNGGTIEHQPATNGIYRIMDPNGKIIALFKPENERDYGPESYHHKKSNPTLEDIHFHKMDSFEQGMLTQRQYYSKLLDHGNRANLPLGTVVEMGSERFNNEELPWMERCKIGYLQEWVPNMQIPDEDAVQRDIPVNDFQKIGIMDVQLYNQDRHRENLLLTADRSRLVNIDSDSILPYKLENNNNFLLQSARAAEPFTAESLKIISQIDPKFNAALARHLGLPEQSAVNAEILASTLKSFSRHGLTLADINAFIGSAKPDSPSDLLKKMGRANQAALSALSKEDKERFDYYEYLRWAKWKNNVSENEEWWQSYHKEFAQGIQEKMQKAFWASMAAPSGKKITFGTTYIPGNPIRDEMSALVDANHKEYAQTWNLVHRTVAENLLKDQCTVNDKPVTCSPYWNKIKVLKDWLEVPGSHPEKEEWYVMADDDMVVTNMGIDPYKAIDDLRKKPNGEIQDTSFIVAKDVQAYTGDAFNSVNTGLLFVRKDAKSLSLINNIWRRRNHAPRNPTETCPTYGVCEKQQTLHEQDALANIIKEDRNIVNSVITVVPPRDSDSATRRHIALNTFERSGHFITQVPGWNGQNCFDYNDPEDGKWRKGDWMGQTAGVPVLGVYCEDQHNVGTPKRLRQGKIEKMLEQVVRDDKTPKSSPNFLDRLLS